MYNGKLNLLCNKNESELLAQKYSYERLLDIFSLYFFYHDIIKEVKNLFLSHGTKKDKLDNKENDGHDKNKDSDNSILLETFFPLFDEKSPIKKYEKHILLKILIIILEKNNDYNSKFQTFHHNNVVEENFYGEKKKPVNLESLLVVLCKYCIEARILMNSMQRYYKGHHDCFLKDVDNLINQDEGEDNDFDY